MRHFFLWSTTSVLFIAFVPLVCADTNDDHALEAAKSRQIQFPTVEIIFKVVEVVEQGAIDWPLNRDTSTKDSGWPKERTTITSTNRLIYDGKRMRYENNHPIFDERSRRWEAVHTIQVTNGEEARSVFGPVSGYSAETSYGKIGRSSQMAVGAIARLLPLNMFFRGYDNSANMVSLKVGDFKFSSNIGPASARFECDQKRSANPKEAVFKKPEWTLKQMRWFTKEGRSEILRIDVFSQIDQQKNIELPYSWVEKQWNTKGLLRTTISIDVQSYRFPDAIDSHEYELVFPGGLPVFDERDKKDYMARDDGTLFLVDYSKTQPEINRNIHEGWFQRNIIILLLSFVLFLMATYVVVRWYRVKSSMTESES